MVSISYIGRYVWKLNIAAHEINKKVSKFNKKYTKLYKKIDPAVKEWNINELIKELPKLQKLMKKEDETYFNRLKLGIKNSEKTLMFISEKYSKKMNKEAREILKYILSIFKKMKPSINEVIKSREQLQSYLGDKLFKKGIPRVDKRLNVLIDSYSKAGVKLKEQLEERMDSIKWIIDHAYKGSKSEFNINMTAAYGSITFVIAFAVLLLLAAFGSKSDAIGTVGVGGIGGYAGFGALLALSESIFKKVEKIRKNNQLKKVLFAIK